MPPTCFTMSTFQLDENDPPVTTHVDMGQIMFPRSGSETNDTAHHDTTTDADRQTNGTNGPTDGGKPGGEEQGDTGQDDVHSDDAQTHNSQQACA